MTCININMSVPPQVLLVTGGYNNNNGELNILDTTETLRPGSEWQVISSAKLPKPMYGVRVTTMDNRVLLFGELCCDVIFILAHTGPCYRWIR